MFADSRRVAPDAAKASSSGCRNAAARSGTVSWCRPATRRLLARIPGLQVVELPDTGCCGAAGLHQLTDPDRAAAFRQPLLEALAASGATRLLSANIGCRLHLAGGTTLPVVHPIDFLAEHLE